MQRISLDDNIKLKNTIVTIGKFDGIHKGHEKLLEVIVNNANGRQKVVLTFETTPSAFLKNNANKTIVTEEEKQILCEQQGVDVYMKMPMKKEFLALSPDEFVSKILKDKIGATTIVCGPDFHFGTKASGNVKFLKDNQKKYGYNLIVVEKEQYHNKDISSTSIRKKITEGKMQDVNEMLGHPYRIIGKVEQGKHLGRTIGLPTANIIPDETKLLPPNGVYRTVVVVEGQTFNAISNVGVNPTVETGTKIKVETHIIDYENYIYNEIVQVQFYDFIRPERTFDSLEKLKQRGAEREMELVAVASRSSQNIEQLFRLKGRHRIALSSIKPADDGKGYIVCLHNMGKQSVCSSFVWGSIRPREVSVCDYRQKALRPFNDEMFWMKPYEYIMLKVIIE